MCFSTAKWQREEVQDHKFDFVDVNEFQNNSFLTRLTYSAVFIIVLKSILVYIADIWTAGILLIFDRWSSAVQPAIPFFISKWIYVICIFISFFLLALDIRKARRIIKTGDISYAFTNTVACRYYTLRSYPHFCFFSKINNSKKKVDEIAFFVFFTFKGWKRLVFAEAPRQIIIAITLYSIFRANKSRDYFDLNEYGSGMVQRLTIGSMAFSLLIFIMSATMFVFAFLLYIPLLCQIRGNLKEYCCHKIDKRIGELLKKNSKKRLRKRQLQAKAEAAGDFSHLKKKSAPTPVINNNHRQPTLPNVDDNPSLPPYPLSQKPTLPEPVKTNFPPHGQNSAGLQGLQPNRSDTNNYLPYKNNANVSYNLPGPGHSQHPQHSQRPQLYTRKTPAPGIPQRGYNNLVAMSEPVPKIHVTKLEPTSQIHAAVSEPIPQIYVERSGHIPQIDAARSEPIPQIDVTTSNPVPQINVAMSEPIPLVPQAYAAAFEPVYQTSITTPQSIPPMESQSTSQEQIQPIKASYDCADIINNYHGYSESGENGSNYGYNNHANNNYSDKNYNYNSNNYSFNNYTNNNYNNFSQPIVDVERHRGNNFASSSQSYQLPNQAALQVDQSMYDYTQQQESSEIIEDYYYAQ